MAKKKKRDPKKPDGRTTKVTERQKRVVQARAEGHTFKEAGAIAGYPTKNAAQSAYQALAGLRGRMTELLNQAGLTEEIGIDRYLKPALEATQTVFFQKDGKVKQQREVVAWNARIHAMKILFDLHGSFPPRDPKEAAQYGVRVIKVDIVRPPGEFNQFIDVIPETALSRHGVKPLSGKPQADKNGRD